MAVCHQESLVKHFGRQCGSIKSSCNFRNGTVQKRVSKVRSCQQDSNIYTCIISQLFTFFQFKLCIYCRFRNDLSEEKQLIFDACQRRKHRYVILHTSSALQYKDIVFCRHPMKWSVEYNAVSVLMIETTY